MDISIVTANVLCCLYQDDNPFKVFPFDTSKNIFGDIIDFGIKHTPGLVKLLATLIKTDAGLNDKSVYRVAFLYSLLVCSANPSQNSSFLKLMTVLLKTSGCTGKK